MIRLSGEQMMALQDAAMHRFVGRVVDELPAYRAPLVEGRSRATLFQSASLAVRQAQDFGLESERALFLFANLAVTLGAHFPTDPALPWAGNILGDASYLGNEKMDDLWNAYIAYCEQAMGPEEGAYFPAAAYRRFASLPAVADGDGTAGPVIADLQALWPEKVAATGPDDLQAHVFGAGQRAEALGLEDYAAKVRYCRIAFLIGQSFDADPLHDWAQQILLSDSDGSDSSIMDRLEARFSEVVIAPALRWRIKEDAKSDDEEDE